MRCLSIIDRAGSLKAVHFRLATNSSIISELNSKTLYHKEGSNFLIDDSRYFEIVSLVGTIEGPIEEW